MTEQSNRIKLQNNIAKEFHQWKEKRYQNHSTLFGNIEKQSIFYKFPQQNSSLSIVSPNLSKKQILSKSNNGQSPKSNNGQFSTNVFRCSLNNFRKTIIKDSLKDKDHILNQIGQSAEQDAIPFVPFINERDKLGRLLNFEKSDVNMNDVNIVEMIIGNNQQQKYKSKDNHLNNHSNPQIAQSSYKNFEEDYDKLQLPYNNVFVKGSNHKKSLSHIPFGYSSNYNVTSNQLDKMRSSSTLYPSLNDISHTKITNQIKLNQLLNGTKSHAQISMVQLPANSSQTRTQFMNIKSYQYLNLDQNDKEQQSDKEQQNQMLAQRSTDPSLCQLHDNKSFTQLISYNSQPCSPSRFIVRLSSPNNSYNADEKIIEFDKKSQLKCSQDEVIRKKEEYNQKHMQARLKRENLQNIKNQSNLSNSQTPFKAKIKQLKFPDSVKDSHACRVLFNHHKKVQKFNKMIDMKDPDITKFEIDYRQNKAEKCKSVLGIYKQRFSQTIGFIAQKQDQSKAHSKQKKEEYRQQMLEKWGERLDTSELDDDDDKYRKKILNPIKTKDQQILDDRIKRQNIFKEYDKYYTNQMYYLEKGDLDI